MSISENAPKTTTGIQQAVQSARVSALRKYQDLVIGRTGLVHLLVFELVAMCAAWMPGALGLILRRSMYPWVLGSVGRRVVFGQGIVLRHPHKIRIGDDVIVDDLVVLDAKGTSNTGITIGDGAFLGRGSILSCKDGDIVLGERANLGFHCEIFSGSRVSVGRNALFAAQSYLVGGGHAFEESDAPVLDQTRLSRGISIGDNLWLGTGAKVMDGVSVGHNVVVGANAVVNKDLPDNVIAAGVPARVLRSRQDA